MLLQTNQQSVIGSPSFRGKKEMELTIKIPSVL